MWWLQQFTEAFRNSTGREPRMDHMCLHAYTSEPQNGAGSHLLVLALDLPPNPTQPRPGLRAPSRDRLSSSPTRAACHHRAL